MRALLVLSSMVACGPALPDDLACAAYPEDASFEMKLGAPIWPYRWGTAIHRDGRSASLALDAVPCHADDDIDWSPFDVLLFVSLPAW